MNQEKQDEITAIIGDGNIIKKGESAMSDIGIEKIVDRHIDFVYAFEATNSAPNIDPATGQPRIDPVTKRGYVTDACIKNKVRRLMVEDGATLYYERDTVLQDANKKIYDKLGFKPKPPRKPSKSKMEPEVEVGFDEVPNIDPEQNVKLKAEMCRSHSDVRWFGATPCDKTYPIGSIHGPIQISNAMSVDPIKIVEITLTRGSKTSRDENDKANQTMGRRSVVRYGLYVQTGSISVAKARKTGLTNGEVEALLKHFYMIWNDDRSTMRSDVQPVGLFVFTHSSPSGNIPWKKLTDRVHIARKDATKEPLSLADYEITVDETDMPKGVSFERKF